MTEETFVALQDKWLPTDADLTFVKSLMVQCIEPGKIAGWIAPPSKGINGNPFEFEYVRV
jgi:benzoyl-CoA 2,3-dioxygenase component B